MGSIRRPGNIKQWQLQMILTASLRGRRKHLTFTLPWRCVYSPGKDARPRASSEVFHVRTGCGGTHDLRRGHGKVHLALAFSPIFVAICVTRNGSTYLHTYRVFFFRIVFCNTDTTTLGLFPEQVLEVVQLSKTVIYTTNIKLL